MFQFLSLCARFQITLLLLGLGTHLLAQEKVKTETSETGEAGQTSPYELLAKGLVGSSPIQVQFKSAPLRLQIRNLIMGHGETEPIPTPTRILLELRQGAVTTTINREKQDRRQGDFWVVDKGSSFTVQNSGEVAVLRGIYIFEGNP
jgi:hypothetical protein